MNQTLPVNYVVSADFFFFTFLYYYRRNQIQIRKSSKKNKKMKRKKKKLFINCGRIHIYSKQFRTTLSQYRKPKSVGIDSFIPVGYRREAAKRERERIEWWENDRPTDRTGDTRLTWESTLRNFFVTIRNSTKF